ncbi:unnamed protein product [Plutella xylostella]|uniref:(diamondback moth) hypothetical protein n=1 Tax=Plutella xylostella TaxID=51655 RepID=A0A8S4GG35_PLUXY|nr:unnamed protein product [Plutella xylostella]
MIANINNQKTTNLNLLQSCSHPQDSVDHVNDYFASVGKRLAEKITSGHGDIDKAIKQNINSIPILSNTFVLSETDNREVEITLKLLKDDCAVGWDSIPAKVLKSSSNVLVPLMTHICNLSFRSGIFPESFKIDIIHPIHKGGNMDSVNNYRPISVLPAMSKILEKLINARLIKFFAKYNILSDNQYGFRMNRSTQDAILNLTDTVVRKLDSNYKCIGIFLDLAKAFDTVSIPTLLDKLERVGFRDGSLKLFNSYLTNRQQMVRIGDHSSTLKTVNFGVPQGSILGPSLFLVYINDLCNLNISKGSIISFADDTTLIFHGESWEDVARTAENGLKAVTEWLRSNLLTLNDTERDETLFGATLGDKIKASKDIEKQGSQIRKVATSQKMNTPQASSSRPAPPGNWSGPPRYSSNMGGRGGQRKVTSTRGRTYPPAHPPARSYNQPKTRAQPPQ